MTAFVAGYDVEMNNHHDAAACLESCRAVVELHERLNIPATLFIVGAAISPLLGEYRAMLRDHPLFELASHSWSHQLLAPHPFGTEPIPAPQMLGELQMGKQMVERLSGKECRGFRAPVGWPDGLPGEVAILVERVGFSYSSSQLWGTLYTMPAPPRLPWRYMVPLWELPGMGWHDNILSGVSPGEYAVRWPVAEDTPLSPDDADEKHHFIGQAIILNMFCRGEGYPYCTQIWHPWSLLEAHPKLGQVETVLRTIKVNWPEAFSTFGEQYERVSGNGV